jgi:hypothetical protein
MDPLGHSRRDPVEHAILTALVLDPRNPFLMPALLDHLERGEHTDRARALRESGDLLPQLAKVMSEDGWPGDLAGVAAPVGRGWAGRPTRAARR